ncbi:MAG: phage holin family protein [Candidatus Vogelbacteria bacterium]|nr:phage holin family protein [Candidatus Vogelbacteria bacterium]
MTIIIRWIINALVLLGIAYIVPGIVVGSFYNALIVAVVLAIVNIILKPILVLLTLPINVMTLGLFTLVINALLFWFASTVAKGFYVEGFIAAFLGSLIFTVFTSVTHKYIK